MHDAFDPIGQQRFSDGRSRRSVEARLDDSRNGQISLGAARPKGHRFHAEVDLGEIDERGRPSMPWAAHAIELSRSHIVVLSRRMTYVGRGIAVAVHLVDAKPTPLFGEVYSCEYEGEGRYRIDIDLRPLPAGGHLRAWFGDRERH